MTWRYNKQSEFELLVVILFDVKRRPVIFPFALSFSGPITGSKRREGYHHIASPYSSNPRKGVSEDAIYRNLFDTFIEYVL